MNFWASSAALSDYGEDYSDSIKPNIETKKTVTGKKPKKGLTPEDEEWFNKQKQKKNETLFYPCDKKSDLYVLQKEFILHKREYSLDVPTNGSR